MWSNTFHFDYIGVPKIMRTHSVVQQSRMVRNERTYLYWTTRRENIEIRILRKEQITNHYAKAGTITTKVRHIIMSYMKDDSLFT